MWVLQSGHSSVFEMGIQEAAKCILRRCKGWLHVTDYLRHNWKSPILLCWFGTEKKHMTNSRDLQF